MSRRKHIVAVIGAGSCDPSMARTAREVGRLLAGAGHIVLTGGLGGVMEAASLGAREAGGLVIGLLPGATTQDANPHVEVPIATGVGEGRNVIIANTADAFVAVGGGYGTLTEIAFALKRGKCVVCLGSWDAGLPVRRARTPEEAVEIVSAELASPAPAATPPETV
jgi:uncharacterized protein (TIGR00725 family)